MEEIVRVHKANETYLKISCSPSIAYELSEYFSFEIPNAKFNPKVRARVWDGKIKLFNLLTHQLYVGLYRHLFDFCKSRNYTLETITNEEYGRPWDTTDIDVDRIESLLDKWDLRDQYGESLEAYDFQIEAIYKGLKYHRRLFLAPTSSGKSLIIYCLLRVIQMMYPDRQQLLLVPSTLLVNQMFSDFQDYSKQNGWNVEENVAKVYTGHEKRPAHPIIISTWQTAVKEPRNYFDRFITVIGDEAHEAKAKSITYILESCYQAKFKIGTTGTLDGLATNKLVLEGLFGPVDQVATTKDLMDRGIVSALKIKCVSLKYQDHEIKAMKGAKYPHEMNFLVEHEGRNRFITNLATAQKGNTLVLFQRIEAHGDKLLQRLEQSINGSGRNVFYIHGGIDADIREQIRKILDTENNAILVASYGTFRRGVSVRNLHSIIMAHPYKSRITVLQSIGRGLRLHKSKDKCILYDIGDNLTPEGRQKLNYSLDHLVQRMDIYDSEQFDYTITEVPLK